MTESIYTHDSSHHRSTQDGNEEQRTDAIETCCPECGGRIIRDESRAERVCQACGCVVAIDQIDHGPEWRAFTAEETAHKRRVGASMTPLLHDKGLSTWIGWDDTDAAGRSLSARQRKRIHRLRTWDERYRTKNSQERNLKQALGEIERMASALGLPGPVPETASVIYRQAIEMELLPGRSIEAMTTASLYAATRQAGIPRRLCEFTPVSRVDQIRIQRAYRYLTRELELGIAPIDPHDYVQRFVSTLDLGGETEQIAHDLIETATTQNLHSGKSPAALAAGAAYAASRLTNDARTQTAVSECSGVSRVTIRERYQELIKVHDANGNR
ncbi:transcription initiation factor IIB [Halocatena salina]|uniref:Transcription initiation factor IIB n=1 Tax=Halocatena salina TaxID=2934340 RepID=A0A8U0A816_9EURY|nr:TFIIB-type zinc ribbon-containing protein [Halocatena salina]UPM45124.1 transcription initiation factor IIB 2 [Halocatena salina]